MQEVACSVVTSGDECWVRLTDKTSGRSSDVHRVFQIPHSLLHCNGTTRARQSQVCL